jgi:putative cell wall-binding protein
MDLHIRAALLLVLALVLAAAPTAPPAVAQSEDDPAPDQRCVPDPAGDTFYIDEEGAEIPESFPRADIREFCVEYGEGLHLSMRMEEPTDPAEDENWGGPDLESLTAAFWFIDAGGGFKHVAVYAVDESGPVVDIVELGGGEDGEDVVRCEGEADYVDGALTAFFPDVLICIGTPDQIDVATVMAYDSDPTDPDARVYLDEGEHVASIGRAGAPTARSTTRLAGESRLETAIAVSQFRFTSRSETVYLARSDDFPDALAAGSLGLAPGTDGPILLVPSCGRLPFAVADEIARLDPISVTALGGETAVCTELLEEAAGVARRANDQRTTRRLAGPPEAPDRYGTAVAISQHAFPRRGAADIYLATGERFPDALAAAPLTDGPIILVPSCDAIPDVVVTEIIRVDPQRVIALGGPGAVCDAVLEAAANVGDGPPRATGRLAGVSRFGTAASIARFQFPEGADEVYLARADDFPDALAAGSLDSGPVILVPSCGDIPVVVADLIRELDPQHVIALGGTRAVCEPMLRQAANS